LAQQQQLKTGGFLTVHPNTIICSFTSPRLVLSTSLFNGGFLNAESIFNHRLTFFVDKESDLPGGSMPKYLALTAGEYGLKAEQSTGLLTSAHMPCRAYTTLSYKELTVEVIATAGVEKNAARAGDLACYYECDGTYHPIGGTINILVLTNINLPYGAMAKTLIGITEAKTAALQELAVYSPLTHNPATGTGTDGIILACNPKAKMTCVDTGTQSKLGELICRSVKKAVKESLAMECNYTTAHQGSIDSRLQRLGIELSASLSLSRTTQHKILLAMTQAVWQEYIWGLLSLDALDYYFTLLKMPVFQPLGADLAAWLQQKVKYVSESKAKQSSGRTK
jgi:adenosylcobinamide hydrolase